MTVWTIWTEYGQSELQRRQYEQIMDGVSYREDNMDRIWTERVQRESASLASLYFSFASTTFTFVLIFTGVILSLIFTTTIITLFSTTTTTCLRDWASAAAPLATTSCGFPASENALNTTPPADFGVKNRYVLPPAWLPSGTDAVDDDPPPVPLSI